MHELVGAADMVKVAFEGVHPLALQGVVVTPTHARRLHPDMAQEVTELKKTTIQMKDLFHSHLSLAVCLGLLELQMLGAHVGHQVPKRMAEVQ